MTTGTLQDTASQLRHCAALLAGMCDGAYAVDGHGYNKMDAGRGRDLAAHPLPWTDRLTFSAYQMLRKYRGQLGAAGVDWDSIPVPPVPAEPQDITAADATHVAVRAPYSAAFVAAVKSIPGRRWDAEYRRWLVPVEGATVAPLRRLAVAHDLEVDEAATALLDNPPDQAAAAVGAPAPVTVTERSVRWENNGFVVRFPYDPAAVAAVKSVPGARWDKTAKAWRVAPGPLMAEKLREVAGQLALEWHGDTLERVATLFSDGLRNLEASSAKEAPTVDITGLGGLLKPFQNAGVAQIIQFNGVALLGDEMGLGKTIQFLAAIMALRAFPALVIAPASLKLNWLREARLWLPGKRIGVVSGTTARDYDVVDTCDVVIVNYDLLGGTAEASERRRKNAARRGRELTESQQRLEEIRQERMAMLKRRQWAAVGMDEAHYLQNYKAQRTQAVKELIKGARVVLPMTGTPVRNRPSELVTLLQMLGKLDQLGGFWGFLQACGMTRGRYGLEQVQESREARDERLVRVNAMLRQVCMIRRLKADVLPELPAKQWATVPLELDNRAEYDKAATNLIAWLREKHPEKTAAALRAERLVRFEHLKRLAAEGKKAAVLQWVVDFVANGSKLVLFAHHVDLQNELGAALRKKLGPQAVCMVQGGSQQKRTDQDAAVRAFQEDERVQVAVCSLMAAGVGITLTAASNVAFVEFAWTPGDMDQAADRCHRIGQLDNVTAWQLVAVDSIDEDTTALVETKRGTVNATVDGVAAGGDTDIMDELVERMKARAA